MINVVFLKDGVLVSDFLRCFEIIYVDFLWFILENEELILKEIE